MRTQLSVAVVAATGGLVTYAGSSCSARWIIVLVLLMVAGTGYVFSRRITEAHAWHWYFGVKMRNVIMRGQSKLLQKHKEVDERYLRLRQRGPRVLAGSGMGFDEMWIYACTGVPLGGGLFVLFIWLFGIGACQS